MHISPNIKFLFAQLAKQKRLLFGSLLLMLIGAAIEPTIPALMRPLLDETIPNRQQLSSLHVPLLLLMAFISKGIIEYFSSVMAQRISQVAVHQIRIKLFNAICNLPFSELRRAEPGYYASKMLNDVNSISGSLSMVWVTIVRDTLIVVFLIIYLVILSWTLTALIFVSLPLAAWLVQASSRKIRRSSRKLQTHASSLNSALVDYFSLLGLRDIFTLGVKSFAEIRVERLSMDLAAEAQTLARRQALVVPLVQVIAAVGVTTAIALALSLPTGLNSSGDFVSFMTAMAMLFEPIKRLTNVNAVIQRGLVGVESVRKVLDQSENANYNFEAQHKVIGSNVEGVTLVLKSKRLDKTELVGCTLELVPGRFIGLVGPSGTGKSTLAQMIAGLDEEFDGELVLRSFENRGLLSESASLSSCTKDHLASEACLPGLIYLGPQPMIFSDSILNNVSFGMDRSKDFTDTKECINRCELGHLLSNINQVIGGGGRTLSAGEAQRLALARVLFFKPNFIILDESTSSMDETTEKSVLRSLFGYLPKLGGLIISHRPSTYQFVDQLWKLENGTIRSIERPPEMPPSFEQ